MKTLNDQKRGLLKQLIRESHERSYAHGLSPEVIPNYHVLLHPDELDQRIRRYKEFLSIAKIFGSRIIDMLSDDEIVILICDHENCILEYFGDERVRRYLASANMVPGACFDEMTIGTSSVFLANLHKQSIAMVGKDHFYNALHESACYSVPFAFENTDISGTITIMTSALGHSNYRLALLESVVESIRREFELIGTNRIQKLVNNIVNGKSPIGLIMINPSGEVTDYNCVAEQLLGLSISKIIGNSSSTLDVLHPLIEQCLQQKKSINNQDVSFVHSNGKMKHGLVDIVYMVDNDQYMGLYVMIRDMTEKYVWEQQMIVADRFSTIGKLAAGLAHEIRNPLTSIMGFMQLIQTEKYDRSNLNRHVKLMYDELLHVKELVSDFVIVSKPGAPNRTSCFVENVIEDTVLFMKSQAILKNVELDFQKNSTPLNQMKIDQVQIKQVLINTIQNAIESVSHLEGHVIVSCEINLDATMCCISVADNGVGMSEEELDQILTPFYTTKDNGTGLGMSVSYRIVENHGGNIVITSKKGLGTTVEINLPYSVN